MKMTPKKTLDLLVYGSFFGGIILMIITQHIIFLPIAILGGIAAFLRPVFRAFGNWWKSEE